MNAKKIIDRLLTLWAMLAIVTGCGEWNETDIYPEGGGATHPAISSEIAASCSIERQLAPLAVGRLSQRALVNNTTTKTLPSNFLRIDEDVDNANNGLYTFTSNDNTTPYSVNWSRAYLIEGMVTASPDNTTDHLRSIAFEPTQSYKIHIINSDTTNFYHTRMVGWYPANCTLPRRDGVAADTQFENNLFDAVRCTERIEIDDVERDIVGIHFTGLDGKTDLMVSDVREGQHWHLAGSNPASDTHPDDPSQSIYCHPFGHSDNNPAYRNFFNYRHYLSAVRIFAYAEQSSQNLSMWGELETVNLKNQPTSCKVWLPSEPGEFGEVYHWGDYKHLPIATGLIFGELNSDAEMNREAVYPISMKGSDKNHQSYLGYALIQPDKAIDIELHTSSGIYSVNIDTEYTDTLGNDHTIFKEGMIYDIHLNLKTDGSIAAILEVDNNEHFYDLTRLYEYEKGESDISTYKYANCYVIDPHTLTVPATGNPYDGYCFSATVIGNGQAGILTSGAQTMYPTSATINPVSAHLLWESKLGLISQVELLYGYVRFRLPDPDAEGNAVIAVYDKDENILWSWHIWVTDMPQQHTFTVGSTEFTILDRNLGATASQWSGAGDALETYGLYYQWGRKDPSMGPPTYNYYPINLITAPYYDYSSQEKDAAEIVQIPQPTLRDGIENPMYLILPTQQTQSYLYNWTYTKYDFLWGYNRQTGITSKTIYDPCPFGYRVSGGELGTLFSYIDGTETFTYTDYGQIRTIPKVADEAGERVEFYFPYTGYKGVDRGLNSLVGSWRYVGRKTDLQSSIISTTSGDSYMHRSRIYLSSESSWSELNVGNYQGHQIVDFTNRRTAAPVRCVKGVQIGRLLTTLDADRSSVIAGSSVNIDCTARSFESNIKSVIVTVAYHLKEGDQHVERVIYSSDAGFGLEWEDSFTYQIPNEAFVETTTGVFRFVLTVQNELGVSRIASTNVVVDDNSMDFTYWQMQDDNDFDAQLPLVGKNISRAVRIYGNAEPTMVTINGVDVTSTKYSRANSTYAHDAYYGIGTNFGSITSSGNMSFTTRGYHEVVIEATYADGTVLRETREITVWGLTLIPKSDTNFTEGSYYVFNNTAYDNTFLYDNGSHLAAENLTQPLYRSLFYISGNSIHNVATGDYCTGYNNVQIEASANSGTQYQFTYNGSSFEIFYQYSSYRSYYWKQTSATVTNVSRYESGNCYWNIYEAEPVAPLGREE